MPQVKKEFTRNGEIVATLYLGDCLDYLAQGKPSHCAEQMQAI